MFVFMMLSVFLNFARLIFTCGKKTSNGSCIKLMKLQITNRKAALIV